MKRIGFALYFLSFTLVSFVCNASCPQTEIKQKMLNDLDIMKSTFEVKYAPAEWKKEYANWDLSEQIEFSKQKVMECSNITLKDYQRILQQFINSTKDYHVGISFYSYEMAFLPLRIQGTQGRYFVAHVDRQIMDLLGMHVSIEVGDEVLEFNGKPVDEVVQDLKHSEFGNPDSATDQALAEYMLTARQGSLGHLVPQGTVNLTLRDKNTGFKTICPMSWIYFPEEILSPNDPVKHCKGKKVKKLGEHPFFHRDMSVPLFQHYQASLEKKKKFMLESKLSVNLEDDEEDHFIGSTKSFVPTLGKVIWEAEDSMLYAYIYKDSLDRKIGYVRIPHFIGGEYTAGDFAYIISKFEKETEALVIDQVDNPGGSLFYLYGLASMLTDQPLTIPTHRETLTQESVYFALDNLVHLEYIETEEDAVDAFGETIDGYCVDLEFVHGVIKYFQVLINEWNSGNQFTQPIDLFGIKELKPHPTARYTKPILVLVNQLDFSCGDFFPALLQDNNRATLLGTRTSGAGGYVLSHSYPNLFGMERHTYTGSIAFRKDSNPIENLGVTPEIQVELTARDLKEGYPDYKSQVNRAVHQILQ